MIKIKYQRGELKDMLSGVLGRNFYLFLHELVAKTLSELEESPKLMNNMVVIVVPHDGKEMGLAQVQSKTKGVIVIKAQSTPEELEETIIHETIHLVRKWDEKKVEQKTKEIHNKLYPQEIAI